MSDETKFFVYLILAAVALFVLIFGGGLLVSAIQCNAKTAEIGFDSRWNLMAGCRIEVTPGQWIPLDNYYFEQE